MAHSDGLSGGGSPATISVDWRELPTEAPPRRRFGTGPCWRSELVARAGKRKEDGGLSRSSVRHLASHLKAFMTWLIHQHGHKDLAGLPEYFALPRAIHAQNGCERPRA